MASHVREQRAFDASLVEGGSFPEHVWLAPPPKERFVEALIEAAELELSPGPPLRFHVQAAMLFEAQVDGTRAATDVFRLG